MGVVIPPLCGAGGFSAGLCRVCANQEQEGSSEPALFLMSHVVKGHSDGTPASHALIIVAVLMNKFRNKKK